MSDLRNRIADTIAIGLKTSMSRVETVADTVFCIVLAEIEEEKERVVNNGRCGWGNEIETLDRLTSRLTGEQGNG